METTSFTTFTPPGPTSFTGPLKQIREISEEGVLPGAKAMARQLDRIQPHLLVHPLAEGAILLHLGQNRCQMCQEVRGLLLQLFLDSAEMLDSRPHSTSRCREPIKTIVISVIGPSLKTIKTHHQPPTVGRHHQGMGQDPPCSPDQSTI